MNKLTNIEIILISIVLLLIGAIIGIGIKQMNPNCINTIQSIYHITQKKQYNHISNIISIKTSLYKRNVELDWYLTPCDSLGIVKSKEVYSAFDSIIKVLEEPIK